MMCTIDEVIYSATGFRYCAWDIVVTTGANVLKVGDDFINFIVVCVV